MGISNNNSEILCRCTEGEIGSREIGSREKLTKKNQRASIGLRHMEFGKNSNGLLTSSEDSATKRAAGAISQKDGAMGTELEHTIDENG